MSTSRRGFLGAALAAAAAVARPLRVRAQTPPAPGPAATPTPAPPDPKAEALAKLARERYGKFLSDEELPMLDERIAALERRSARLRGFRLKNSEEPAGVFRAGRR
jgi:hypothetical protein